MSRNQAPATSPGPQTYLRSTGRDLEDLLEWARRRYAPIAVRLVKGAYWDYEVVRAMRRGWPIPVFTEKRQSDVEFEVLSRQLLDHHHLVRPALASHNVRSLSAGRSQKDGSEQ